MGLCASSVGPKRITVNEWKLLFDSVLQKLQTSPDYTSPLQLMLMMDSYFSTYHDFKDQKTAFSNLCETLSAFQKAKKAQDESVASGAPRTYSPNLSGSEKRELTTEQAMRFSILLRTVVRFLQRQALIWQDASQGLVVPSDCLINQEEYCVIDEAKRDVVDPKKNESKKRTKEELLVAKMNQGWTPGPKASVQRDWVDCFEVGNSNLFEWSDSDPLHLFFKVRQAASWARVAELNTAIETLRRPIQLAKLSLIDLSPEQASELRRMIEVCEGETYAWDVPPADFSSSD